jgi:hypothetical protein
MFKTHKSSRPFTLAALGLAALCALPSVVHAHYIWIERGAKDARLYFGEVAEVREQSPGRMDDIRAPKAWALGAAVRGAGNADHTLAVERTQRYFSLAGALSPQLIARETSYPVKDWSASGLGIVKPMYYARHSAWPLKQAVASTSELPLDIQPVHGSADAFLVLFNGKPLANTKLVVYAPNDWQQDHKTDDAGRVRLALPWHGQYVLEAIHKEPQAGEFEGKPFDTIRHRATLTVVQTRGISAKGTGGGASGHGAMH